jgi:uncharacterized membrane protein (GlpM family)
VLLIVGAKGDTAGFRQACIAGAKTIPACLAFPAVCYFAVDRATTASPCSTGLPHGLSWHLASSWHHAGLNDDLDSLIRSQIAVACACATR